MSSLDVKGEVQSLVDELHLLSADVMALSKLHTSIQWQSSRIIWLKEGDANSIFFYA